MRYWRYEKQSKACHYRGIYKESLSQAWDRVKKEDNAKKQSLNRMQLKIKFKPEKVGIWQKFSNLLNNLKK
jgi:hypothetical protein